VMTFDGVVAETSNDLRPVADGKRRSNGHA
jgi:hypothetical protein